MMMMINWLRVRSAGTSNVQASRGPRVVARVGMAHLTRPHKASLKVFCARSSAVGLFRRAPLSGQVHCTSMRRFVEFIKSKVRHLYLFRLQTMTSAIIVKNLVYIFALARWAPAASGQHCKANDRRSPSRRHVARDAIFVTYAPFQHPSRAPRRAAPARDADKKADHQTASGIN